MEDFGWRHGEAVAVGLVFAAELGGRRGGSTRADVDRHRALVDAMGLPTRYAGDWARLQSVMRVDKKARGASLRFVVLDGLANPAILTDPDQAWLDAAWAAVSEGDRVTIQVLNGANLGRLGLREPDKYGTTTYAELVELIAVTGRELGLEVQVRQTDDEGELLRWVHAAADAGDPVVINPAGWSHTSVVLRDALAQLNAPLVEVHITNIHTPRGVPAPLLRLRGRRRGRSRAWACRATSWRWAGWPTRACR